MLPYLKRADVQWLLKKWTGALQTKDAFYSLHLWACRPVSELKLGTGSRESLIFGNQDSIVIVFLMFTMVYGCNFF